MARDFDEKKNTEYSNEERAHLFILCDAKLKEKSILLSVFHYNKRCNRR